MEEFIQLTIFIIGIILLARLSALISIRFGLPTITVQLLIGILLGPSLFNLLGTPIVLGTWGSIPPTLLYSILKILAEIGLIQLMFLAGLQTKWGRLKENIKPIFSVGGWGFVVTVIGVAIITRSFLNRWPEALALSAIMATSSFGISVYTLSEMRLLGSRVSGIISGVGLLSGLLGILLMITSQAANYAMGFGLFKAAIAVSWFLGKLIMFFAISYFLMSRFLSRIVKTGFGKRPFQTLIGYLLLVAALYAWAAMHFGSFAAVGVSSLGGTLLGMSSFGLKEKIEQGLSSFLSSLPVGVLFLMFGMEVNFRETDGNAIYLIILFLTVVATKFVGYWIPLRRVFESSTERGLIVFGILSQGEMGMLIAAYLFSRGLLNPSQFNIAIITVVILTMVSGILMKLTTKLSLRGALATKQSHEIASLRSQ